MKRLRRLTEAEVIAEFFGGEFFHKEYDADREQFSRIVNQPDLTNERENEAPPYPVATSPSICPGNDHFAGN
jgi:hypothetical protein